MTGAIAAEIFSAGLAAADPAVAVRNAVHVAADCLHAGGREYPLQQFQRILVVGAGKASSGMAQALEALLGERITAGLVIVKYGHTVPLRQTQQVEAAHPVPDEAGMQATRRILQMAQQADENTLLICLLSGGASALLVAPVENISLQHKQQATQLLLNSGAAINELNAVRKHLSQIKGGRLAQAAAPASVLTLILSDVIASPPDVIASGPTAADGSSYADACAVLEKYRLSHKIPAPALHYLQAGVQGLHTETLKSDDPCLEKVCNVIVGSNEQALAAAAHRAQQLGWAAQILSSTLHGEARTAAQWLAQQATQALADMQPGDRRCLLAGGETTVTVTGNGSGGRSQELALAFALAIDGCAGITLLSAGTDGTDGPNDAAGATVDGATVMRARQHGIDAADYLRNNDSYHFLQRLDAACGTTAHFKTGPTGTNVMDMQIVLLEKQAAEFM